MSKPFDLEAAKRGEPVEINFMPSADWEPVHFVGLDKIGLPVFQRVECGPMFSVRNSAILRMASKKVTVRFRPYLQELASGGLFVFNAHNDQEATSAKNDAKFRGWLTDWQEAEIPQ